MSSRNEILKSFGETHDRAPGFPEGASRPNDPAEVVGRIGDLPATAGLEAKSWTADHGFQAMVHHQLIRYRRGEKITGAVGQYLANTGAPITPTANTSAATATAATAPA